MAETTTVLDVRGLHWATSAPIIESTLRRRPGVVAVSANAANQTATVTFDPAGTTLAQLTDWVRDCGFHCRGRAVPDHICEPMADAGPSPDDMMGHGGHGAMSMDAMVRDMRNRFL